MKELLAGYRRFRAGRWPEEQGRFEALAKRGQSPHTLILGCIDSRAHPSVIFDIDPGEVLEVRNVANLVPPYAPDKAYHGTSAALEFGVRVLEVRNIIVLGHEECGGVNALLNGAPPEAQEFVSPWMSMAAPARDYALQSPPTVNRQQCCEFEVVKLSLRNLVTFPWIAERVAAEKVKLYGMWFEIRTGTLRMLQPDGFFVPAEEAFGESARAGGQPI
jgi:carbonic anhydrase